MDDRPTQMWTTDRTAQVNWIMELASDLHSNWQGSAGDYADGDAYAEDVVAEWLRMEASVAGEELPDWWSDHDRALLVRFLAEKYTA